MSRYDGLIIPRSYSEYINKTDAATLQQALQLSGVLSGAVAAGDNKAVKSSAVNAALGYYYNKQSVDNKLNGKLDKSILNGNQFYIEYITDLANYELPFNGFGFIFRLFNTSGFEYIQIAIAPLSNNYNIWRPPLTIQIRVKNPNENAWLAWKVINTVSM